MQILIDFNFDLLFPLDNLLVLAHKLQLQLSYLLDLLQH